MLHFSESLRQFIACHNFPMNFFRYFGKTPCTGDRLFSRPVPTQASITK